MAEVKVDFCIYTTEEPAGVSKLKSLERNGRYLPFTMNAHALSVTGDPFQDDVEREDGYEEEVSLDSEVDTLQAFLGEDRGAPSRLVQDAESNPDVFDPMSASQLLDFFTSINGKKLKMGTCAWSMFVALLKRKYLYPELDGAVQVCIGTKLCRNAAEKVAQKKAFVELCEARPDILEWCKDFCATFMNKSNTACAKVDEHVYA
jgi:hypothetical protein